MGDRLTNFVLQGSMVLAPASFACAMMVLAPQQDAFAAMSGDGSFLRSLQTENGAWMNSHALMLLGAFLYIPAAVGVSSIFVRRNALVGLTVGAVFLTGSAGIIGQLALDFAYGVMSREENIADMSALRTALTADSYIGFLFYQAANAAFVLGMALLALISIVTNWAPRISGLLVLAGWGVILTLHGQVSFAETAGHGLIAAGFLIASMRLWKARA